MVRCLIVKKQISSLCVKWPDMLGFLQHLHLKQRETSSAAQNPKRTGFVSLWHQRLMTNMFQAFSLQVSQEQECIGLWDFSKKKKENVFFCSTFLFCHQGQSNFLKRCENLQLLEFDIWGENCSKIPHVVVKSHILQKKKKGQRFIYHEECAGLNLALWNTGGKWNYEGQNDGEGRVHCVSSVWGRFSATRKIHRWKQRAAATGRRFYFLTIGLKQNESFFFLRKNKMPPTNRWVDFKQQNK